MYRFAACILCCNIRTFLLMLLPYFLFLSRANLFDDGSRRQPSNASFVDPQQLFGQSNGNVPTLVPETPFCVHSNNSSTSAERPIGQSQATATNPFSGVNFANVTETTNPRAVSGVNFANVNEFLAPAVSHDQSHFVFGLVQQHTTAWFDFSGEAMDEDL